MHVVLADLFCRDEEHLEFNACLIETVASNADTVVVFAEEGLIRQLKERLIGIENIDYSSYRIYFPKARVFNYVTFIIAFVRYFLLAKRLPYYRKIVIGMDVFVQPCCFRALTIIGQLKRVVDCVLLHHQMPRFVRVPQLKKLYDGLADTSFYTLTCGGVDLFNEIMTRPVCYLLPHPLYRADERCLDDSNGPVKVFSFGKHAQTILKEDILERYIKYTSQLLNSDYEVHLYIKGEGLPELRDCCGVAIYVHYYHANFSRSEYEQLFFDYHLFWMSASIDYRIRASGVVFDAIRMGCFVIDPSEKVLPSNIAEVAELQKNILSSLGGVRKGADFQIQAHLAWNGYYESMVRRMLSD